jgi:leucyl-tRNA synthetase
MTPDMQRYNPKDIEPKWQKTWDETGVYTANLQSDKPKYIAMSMFNYPSGNLHIGHAMNFTISDVKARFKRQQGFESYHPIGWDSFGLPAENRAIKEGLSPQESMAQLIPEYHTAYKAMGWSNDWEKEIATHLPEYYKWTQWVFSEMYRNGLAYQDSRMQWWCELDNSVLANEQVIDGKCWRHDGPDDPLVQKKEVKQWFFKITDYADELLDATDSLDWTETVKLAQKNWIGKSNGAEVTYAVKDSDAKITVFTIAHDTMFGTTFIVLAPEHALVSQITTSEQKAEVDKYVKETQLKSELERMSEKTKTGVFTGAYAINPLSGAEVPVWIADYVLAGYGTGAVMGVPGEDGRDFEFAQKYSLEIIYTTEGQEFVEYHETIKKHPEAYKLANSGEFDGLDFKVGRQKMLEKLVELGAGEEKVNYKMRDWSVSRQRYWGAPIPIINCPKDGAVLVPDSQLPVVLPELDDFKPSGDGRSALARATDWLKVECPECGGSAERETDTLDTYICSSWYMYRYMDPRNQEQIFDSATVNKWEPIDFYNGGDHATAHLLYARFIGHFFKKLGLVNEPEPFKQFLFNGKIMAADGTMFSKSKGNGIDPLEIINQGYGADALRMFLMFAAPLDTWARWDPQGVPATHRFISRLWNLTQEYLAADEKVVPEDVQKQLLHAIHGMIKKMTVDIEENRYNTAIATAMGTLNELYKLKVDSLSKSVEWQQALEAMIACIAPFAPFAAEELWFQLGHHMTVHKDTWPKWEEQYLVTDTVTIAVQINGKLRGEIEIAPDAAEAQVIELAQANDKVQSHLEGHEVVKTIYIPGKIVNIVAK